MFTGLVEEKGRLRQVERRGSDGRLMVGCGFSQLVLGESIAVDGACLTVESIVAGGFVARASEETLSRTTLRQARPGQVVHLERAVALGTRLGGHIVTGHVDGVGRVLERCPRGDALEVRYELPGALEPLVAEKGSIAVDGVSLTVNRLEPGSFTVMLVPFTRGETHLDRKQPGQEVNLETDVLAKYVARLVSWSRGAAETRDLPGPRNTAAGDISLDLLLKQGFGS